MAWREVDANSRAMFEDDLKHWIPDLGQRRPFVVSLTPDRAGAAAVCASARMNPAAHEAGVETAKAHRHNEHAANAVSAWAALVRKTGALPLYSTSWTNLASQAVARKTEMNRYGVDYHVS
jgi:hypothetical protein